MNVITEVRARRFDKSPRGRREEAVAFLLGRINYERAPVLPYSERTLKLARMDELLERIGRPEAGLPIVHVAGTKGKGSTTAMIGSMLTAAGYRTGLFTSPHLERIEERFCVDGVCSCGEELADLVESLRPAVAAMDATTPDSEGGPTYFEITTALALLHFAKKRVDAAVLEVGLGGRLDSTNVCTPTLCVITSISFDHTKQLGNSLASIAAEKAGIIKPGVPVVCGVREDEPLDVIAATAKWCSAELLQVGREFDYRWTPVDVGGAATTAGSIDFLPAPRPDRGDATVATAPGPIRNIALPLLGAHQGANAATALAAVSELKRQGWKIDEAAIRKGLGSVQIPARIEIVKKNPTVVVDAAHNLASVRALVDVLRDMPSGGERVLILAATIDKDVSAIIRELLPLFDRVIATEYKNNPRAMPSVDLARRIFEMRDRPRAESEKHAERPPDRRCSVSSRYSAVTKIETIGSPAEAWRHVAATAAPHDLICSTGSFFLAAEMRRIVLAQPSNC